MELEIDVMREDEAEAFYDMVERVSEAMVCADFEPEGRDEFFGAVKLMLFDRPDNHVVLVARQDGRPVGLLDLRSRYHICLFFVELGAQGRGIGRALFDETVRRYGTGKPFFEVNSSLFAVPVYESLGFVKTSGVQLVNGIRFVEMTYGGHI